jgi:hypothetical protein
MLNINHSFYFILKRLVSFSDVLIIAVISTTKETLVTDLNSACNKAVRNVSCLLKLPVLCGRKIKHKTVVSGTTNGQV